MHVHAAAAVPAFDDHSPHELEAWTQSLSITTFRYVPSDVEPGSPEADDYLNELNRELLARVEHGGRAFVSNAVVDGVYLLRACIVNFRTSRTDVQELVRIVKQLGAEVHGSLEAT